MRTTMCAVVFLVVAISQAVSQAASKSVPQAATDGASLRAGAMRAHSLHSPLAFEPNVGQGDASALFLLRGSGYVLDLESTQARISLPGAAGRAGDKRPGVSMQFLGTLPSPEVTGKEMLPGRHNYLSSGDATEHVNIPTYGKVQYRGLYPGIDLAFYGSSDSASSGRLEYDFDVAAGSDPAQIRLALDGAERVTTDRDGNLVLQVNGKTIRFLKPVAYQTQPDGSRRSVEAAYRIAGSRLGGSSKRMLTFAVGNYDRSQALTIDPVVDYSFYLPATVGGHNFASAGTTDAAGNTYIAGALSNTDSGANGYKAGYSVAKFNSAGQEIFQTTLGTAVSPNFDGQVTSIAVDPAGKIYLAGVVYGNTLGGANGFETTSPNPYGSGFLSAISADGSTLTYSTYFGGSIFVNGVAADSNGNAYLVGNYRNDTTFEYFPVTAGAADPNPFPGLTYSAFLAKLDTKVTGAASLIYGTYIPGSNASAVQVDTSGNAYITGDTNPAYAFPVSTGSFQYKGRDPSEDAYVIKVNATGTAFGYSALLGPGSGKAIALDASNNAYIAGTVNEDDYPVTVGAYQTSYSDGFVTELNAAGSAQVYSTFLGGPSGQFVNGAQLVPTHIALPPACTSDCEAYVAGYTNLADFPLINQVQGYVPGSSYSGFYVELASKGTAALQSSYFASGAGFDPYQTFPGIGVDSASNIYLTGDVLTGNLPVTKTQTAPTGEGFLAKISPAAGSVLAVSPPSVNFGTQVTGVSTAKQGLPLPTVLLENLGTEAATISSITSSNTNVFSSTNNCNGTVAAGGNCTLTLSFTPGAVSGNPQTGTIKIASSASINPTLALTGTAVDDRYIVSSCGGVTPCAGLSFPDVAIGSSSSAQIVTLTNLGDNAVAFSAITSSAPDYVVLTNCPETGATLSKNASCEVSVQFRPTQAGKLAATVSAFSVGTTSNTIAVAATGTGLLSPNASSLVLMESVLNFGTKVIGGETGVMTLTVFNNGSSAATVFTPTVTTSGDASGVDDYAIVSNTCAGAQVSPDASCTIGIAFAPTATGTRGGTVTVPNSTSATLSTSLTGIGTSAGQNLEFTPSSFTFADQVVGIASGVATVAVVNAGSSPVTIDRVVLAGASYVLTATNCPTATLQPAPLASQYQTCQVSVIFDPVAIGAQTATVTVIDTEGRQSAFSFAGKGVAANGAIQLGAGTLNFGAAPVGSTTSYQNFNVTNIGNSPVTVTGFSTTGDFLGGTVYCKPPVTIAPGSGCGPYSVAFSPTKVSSASTGTFVLATTAGNSTMGLTGVGIQATKSVLVTPPIASGVVFGQVQVGTSSISQAYSVDVYNSGSDPVTFSALPTISGSDAADYSVQSVSGACGGAGTVLNAGANCRVYLSFKPSAAGARKAVLTISDDAATANGVQSFSLTGTGTTAAPGTGLGASTVTFAPQVITTASPAAALSFYNNGTTSITIASTTFTPAGAFVHSQNYYSDCNEGAVAAGKSCLDYVIFSPTTTGAVQGVMTLTDTNGNTYKTNLFGYGLPETDAIFVDPVGLAFAPQPLRSTSGQISISIYNQSSLGASFGAATGSNTIVGSSTTGAFKVVSDSCSNTVQRANYGYPCPVSVVFTPTANTALGKQTGSITFPVTFGDGKTVNYVVQLTGTAVADYDSAELSSGKINFPDQAVNATPSANAGDGYQSFSITNKSNLSITIGQSTATNTFNYYGLQRGTGSFGYNPDGCASQTLAPNVGCVVQLAFLPTASGAQKGSLAYPITFADGKTTTLTATYAGNALAAKNSLIITPASADYGTEVVGQSTPLLGFTLTNTGNQPIAFGAATLTSTTSGTNFVRNNFDYGSCSNTTLVVGGSCSFNIAFTPQATGTIKGVLTIADGSATGGPHTIPLVGTGVAAAQTIVASQSAVDFGNRATGIPGNAETIFLTNQSTTNVGSATFTLGGTNSSDFSLASVNCGSTLFNHSTCALKVNFSPATASLGLRNATVTVAYGTTGSPITIALSGTGVTATPAATLFPASLNFPLQNILTRSAGQIFSVTNTGSANLVISSVVSTNSTEFPMTLNACSNKTLTAGQYCLVAVAFDPSTAGARTGSIQVTDNAGGSPQTLPLTGTGQFVPMVKLSPASLTFSSQNVGTTSATQVVTVSNPGTATVTFSKIALGGSSPADYTETTTCGSTLAVGASCTITVGFGPKTEGSRTATVVLTDNANNVAASTQSIPLSGTAVGVPQAAITPATVSFGSQTVASASAAQSVTLTNKGTGALAIASVQVTGTDAAEFAATNGCPTSLAIGASCTISLVFTPSAAGSRSASLVVTDNSGLVANSTQIVALSGTGVPLAATPAFSPAGGSYAAGQSVQLSDTTSGATIYYTTDGTTPKATSKQYSTPIAVSSSETIQAIAVATGFTNSAVAKAVYTITP